MTVAFAKAADIRVGASAGVGWVFFIILGWVFFSNSKTQPKMTNFHPNPVWHPNPTSVSTQSQYALSINSCHVETPFVVPWFCNCLMCLCRQTVGIPFSLKWTRSNLKRSCGPAKTPVKFILDVKIWPWKNILSCFCPSIALYNQSRWTGNFLRTKASIFAAMQISRFKICSEFFFGSSISCNTSRQNHFRSRVPLPLCALLNYARGDQCARHRQVDKHQFSPHARCPECVPVFTGQRGIHFERPRGAHWLSCINIFNLVSTRRCCFTPLNIAILIPMTRNCRWSAL